MAAANVTIIMSPREGFSDTRRAVESLYADAGAPFDFLCVDGGSPAPVRDYLREESARRGFRLVGTPYYLTENEARNLGLDALGEIKTPYALFLDNDVVGKPGWLKELIACAEETGAAVVSPMICIGEPLHAIVHVGGGEVAIVTENGKRIFREMHRFSERPLAEVSGQIVREPVAIAEFHCVLIRTEWLNRLGRFDENLKTTSEHSDMCLALQAQGAVLMIEPRAVVTQTFGHQLALNELAYFFFRWDHQMSMQSEIYFRQKWDTVFDDEVVRNFVHWRRRHALPRLQKALRFFVGWRLSEWMFERIAEAFVWSAMRRRPARLPSSVSRPAPEKSAKEEKIAA